MTDIMAPPPSTSAVAGTKKKKKKKGGLTIKSGGAGGIKIKPFARPPSLPANFYETSVGTLLKALGCVLREEPLYVDVEEKSTPCASPKSAAETDPAAGGSAPMDLDGKPSASSPTSATSAPTSLGKSTRRPMSREELYRLVEDLVTHGYGPQLYRAVLEAVDEAALTCLWRMVDVAPGCVSMGDGVSGGGGSSGSGNGGVLFVPTDAASAQHDHGAGADSASTTTSDAILNQIHAVCGSYYEYLRCVRSVFLHLDRRFVYLPGAGSNWKR